MTLYTLVKVICKVLDDSVFIHLDNIGLFCDDVEIKPLRNPVNVLYYTIVLSLVFLNIW